MELNNYIINTNLKLDASLKDIEKICDEAIKYHLDKVCINPYYVSLAIELLKDSNVIVETAISYPLGQNTTNTKAYEAIEAVNQKVSHIMLVVNHAMIKNQNYEDVKEEIEEIRDSIDGKDLTVLINPDFLEEKEIIKIVEICNDTFINTIALETDNDELLEKIIPVIKEHKIDLLEIRINKDTINLHQLENLVKIGVNYIGTSNVKQIMEEK